MKRKELLRGIAAVLLLLPVIGHAEKPVDVDSQKASSDQLAREAMQEAHDARAVWHHFPGFTAEVTIQTDAESHTGTIHVTDDFDYELTISDEAIQPWIHSKLRSVIGHRRPGSAAVEVQVAEQETSPEFGIFVARKDGSGTFRIENGLIREVLRKTDSNWLEITNVEMFDAGDGKVLPETSSVSYRDPKTGDLTKNVTNRFTWTRAGDFFLPSECFTIETGAAGARQTRQLTFRNHKLTEPK